MFKLSLTQMVFELSNIYICDHSARMVVGREMFGRREKVVWELCTWKSARS